MIGRFPQFLQYLVIEQFVPFNTIIYLSQTCKDLHKWVIDSFRAYYVLCLWNLIKNDTFLSESNLYKNIIERQLFQCIYRVQKNKKSFKIAALENCIPILDWWLTERIIGKTQKALDYSSSVIDHASYYMKINVLNWWFENAIKYPNIIQLRYSDYVINYSSYCGTPIILDWWFYNALKYPNIVTFKYSMSAIDYASLNRNIDILNWWLAKAIEYPNIIILKYSKTALDYASLDDNLNILNWWLENALKYPNLIELKYSDKAMEIASTRNNILVLNWWFENSKKYPNLIKLKYSKNAIDNSYKFPSALDWWKNSGLQLEYSDQALYNAVQQGAFDTFKWWFQSGLPIKLSQSTIDYLNYCKNNLWEYADQQQKIYNWLNTENFSNYF